MSGKITQSRERGSTRGWVTSIALTIFVVIVISVFAQVVTAEMSVVSNLPNGPSFDIIEQGGYAYVAEGGEVRVYDVSTDAKASGLSWRSVVGHVTVGDAIYGLSLSGTTLYVASAGKLALIDISSPSSPRVIGTINNPVSYSTIRDVVVTGTTVYLAINGGGVQVVDVTDPTRPVLGKRVTFQGYNRPWRLAIEGTNLYVPLETDGRLEVLDISTPANPIPLGTYNAGETTSFSAVAVKGGYAYLAEYHGGVRVIDVSNLKAPLLKSRVTDLNANDIQILGEKAYVSVRYQGFSIYDISMPGTMTVVGQGTGMAGYIEGIWPTLGRVYLAGESFGFAVYDTKNPATPTLIVNVPVIGGVDSLAAYGNYAVIGAHNYGIWVVDVTDQAHPQEVAFVDIGGRNRVVDIEGTTLYTAGEWGGLSIIDMSNPKAPSILAKDFGDDIAMLLADGNYVYTQAGVVDVSTRTSPAYLLKDAMFNGKFAKYGTDYLLVADSQSSSAKGLRVLDIRDKTKPVVLASALAGTAIYDVAVVGTSAVALAGNDVIALDLSDVAHPREQSRLSYEGTWVGYALFAEGTTVYAAGGPSGAVRAFDLSSPASMRMTGLVDLPATDYYTALTGGGGYLYAGNKWGIYGLSSGAADPAPTPSPTPTPQQPKYGGINVVSTPAGAFLSVDGVDSGVTPKVVSDLPVGRHTVKVSLSGYADYLQSVEVTAGTTTPMLNAQLTPTSSSGSIYVTSSLNGAVVILDGVEKGTTPLTIGSVSPGSHQVKVTMTGFRDYSTMISVTANSVSSVSVNLVKLGAIRVTTQKNGATVFVDGKKSGTTPVTISGLSDGWHLLKVTMEGYQNYQERVKVSAYEVVLKDISLVPLAVVKVTSTYNGATVYLDGKVSGTTPLTINGVTTGRHVVNVTNEGYQPYTTTVKATAGKTFTVSANLIK
jgi:hypothetical protein